MVKEILEYVQSFTVIGLVLFGIGGFSYHLFRDEGWVEAIIGNVWDVGVEYPLITIPVIIAAVFLGKLWSKSRTPMGRTSKVPDLFIYALMAAGVVFIGRWFVYGTL
jgi:hypothetical protein